MIVWIIWALIGALLELYAIKTGEVKFPTLSRTLWKIFRLEDKGWDRLEKFTRWTLAIVMLGAAIWGVIHIAFGPCAFGWC